MCIVALIMWLASASAAINGLGEIEAVASVPTPKGMGDAHVDPIVDAAVKSMAANTNNGQIVLLVISICAIIAFVVGLFVMWWNQRKAAEAGGEGGGGDEEP